MKARDWAIIVYEEKYSIDTIIDILEEKGIICAISPLHDKDIYTKEDMEKWEKTHDKKPEWKIGDYKKPHYHILIHYNGPTTYNSVLELSKEIGATIPKKVVSNSAYYKYLCHLNNKEKAQYNIEDIKIVNDFQVTLTEDEILIEKIAILEDIKANSIKEYKDLIDFYMENGDVDRLNIASKQTMFFSKYLNSKRYSEN